MGLLAGYSGLTRPQKTAIWASYLGWTLDAFDYFLMVFMLKAIGEEFHAGIEVERRAEWDHPSVGRFARIDDLEGNPIELWEPPAEG